MAVTGLEHPVTGDLEPPLDQETDRRRVIDNQDVDHDSPTGPGL
jgi:hypothetical protein